MCPQPAHLEEDTPSIHTLWYAIFFSTRIFQSEICWTSNSFDWSMGPGLGVAKVVVSQFGLIYIVILKF